VSRYEWVASRKTEGFPAVMACEVARVSCQAFYDWCARVKAGPTVSDRAETELVSVMREASSTKPMVLRG